MCSNSTPVLDTSKIDYPSDKLTVKIVRAEDQGFEHRIKGGRPFSDLEAGIFLERALAHAAFDSALKNINLSRPGRNKTDLQRKRKELVDAINAFYELFQISTGVKQTSELIRQIETQAAEQARTLTGLNPNR